MRIPLSLPPLGALAQSLWQSPMLRYRADVASRALVAIVGGYFLGGASAALLVRLLLWLEVARNTATTAGPMFAFIMMAVAAIYVFGCRSTLRAWLVVALPSALCYALAWWLIPEVAVSGGAVR